MHISNDQTRPSLLNTLRMKAACSGGQAHCNGSRFVTLDFNSWRPLTKPLDMSHTQATPHQRFDVLDGVRGLAAIAVLIHHLTQHNGLHLMVGAYAAVDLFFILSGFVIMHSYGEQIRRGMSFKAFAKARVIRLAPLYLLGLALGFVATTAAVLKNPAGPIDMQDVLTAAGLGLFMIPDLNFLSWPLGDQLMPNLLFPLNDPSWSLFFELFINVCFFYYIARFRTVQIAFVAAMVIAFVVTRMTFDFNNPGWGSDSFLQGFPRVAAEFFIGAWLYQSPWRPKLNGLKSILPWTLLAVVFAFFYSSSEVKAMENALILEPAAILASARLELDDILRKVCKLLGDWSYPLYITHFPLYRLALNVFDLGRISPTHQLIVMSAVALASAAVFNELDKKVRRALTVRFQ